jgi:hypothetical protein
MGRIPRIYLSNFYPVHPVYLCSTSPLPERPGVTPDDRGDIFLESAVAARASYLITGNPRHFPGSWQQVLVVTPGQLLDVITSQESENALP